MNKEQLHNLSIEELQQIKKEVLRLEFLNKSMEFIKK
jgi:hypothetical protein